MQKVGQVRYGISISDIQTVIGSGIKDIGGLIANGSLNMWAKHKPFRNSAIGFPFDISQSTPELRCPNRVSQALLSNFGLTIPRFNASDFKTHYSDVWTYNRPRGLKNTLINPTANDEWFRVIDFDGYLHNCYWQLGSVSFEGVQSGYYTIFNGYLSTPRTPYIYPGDLITFELQCAEDPDAGLPGLLYPYSFHEQTETSRIDISKYYIGIAIITGAGGSNPTLWIKTGDQMLSHITAGDITAYLNVRVPNSIALVEAKIIPVLTSVPYSDWDDAPGSGYFVSLNGVYLSRTIRGAQNKITANVVITYSNGNVTMVFTLTNGTSSDVNVENLYTYVLSAESFYNEGDISHGFNPPVDSGYGIRDYIPDRWQEAASYFPPDSHMGTNPPDIYLTDWVDNPSLTPPAYLAARGYNSNLDFKSANNNSSLLRTGQTVTWSKTMNIGQSDGFGYYSGGVFVALCIYVPGSKYVEEFSNLID